MRSPFMSHSTLGPARLVPRFTLSGWGLRRCYGAGPTTAGRVGPSKYRPIGDMQIPPELIRCEELRHRTDKRKMKARVSSLFETTREPHSMLLISAIPEIANSLTQRNCQAEPAEVNLNTEISVAIVSVGYSFFC